MPLICLDKCSYATLPVCFSTQWAASAAPPSLTVTAPTIGRASMAVAAMCLHRVAKLNYDASANNNLPVWNPSAKTRYRVTCIRYRYIVILYPISGTIFCDTISGHTRYWVTRYRVVPDIRYTRYRVCPDIGTDIHDQDIPISGPHVPISCQ